MTSRIIIAGRNNRFPRDAAQSCGAYLNQMPRPDLAWGLEAAARSVVLPTRERAAPIISRPRRTGSQAGNLASFPSWDEAPYYDATAERWIRRPSTTMVDADAVAVPRHFVESSRQKNRSPQTDCDGPVDGSNHATGFIHHAVEVATVLLGLATFGSIAYVLLLLA